LPNHEPRNTNHGFFVTGTDTGVGKTLMTCALLGAFAARGYTCVGMKPVACGAEARDGELINHDVEQIRAAGNVVAPRQNVNPYCFAPPIAPHIAAQRASTRIALGRIEESFRLLAALARVVVVEGVGGFRVPLGAGSDTAGLAVRLGLPVVLVVGMRLGCLNHALLAAEAIAARRLRLAGWIANHVDREMAAADENLHALQALIDAPLLARVAFATEPRAGAIAAVMDTSPLIR
jgi:dethiobiotin synthetase